ncbi:MAG TPA: guanitoxin biosynthesis PLP-dependent transaminase GntE [Caldilineaceae bacterium]|nr:guanitoxin biosynthesis PLP-dependent transaminase GntE [Caldilineaceae bacterium]
MSTELSQTRRLFHQAKQYIPYGVNSNFRYWGDDRTFVITRGQGAHIWDADGNRYIDYRLGFGPIILGHAYPAVNRRVCEAIQDGTLFAFTTPWEIELAERFTRMTGMDKVRLSNTGAEATMHALRIARAYTGRERFIKFEGQYHGNYDYVMYSTPGVDADLLGPRQMPRRVKGTEGMPAAIRQYMISLPYNDFELLEAAVESSGEEIAAVMVEPVMGNVAGVLPKPGWLETIRRLCDDYGIVLIFDEVKTGFRLARGGAQEYFGVKADLAAYAKAMGNGFPVSAVAGKDEIMAVVEPGKVAHGGTYCGNVVAAAAACATLEIIETEPVIETIFARGQELMDGMHDLLSRAGIPHVVTGIPSMFSLMVGSDQMPTDYRSYCANDFTLYEKLAEALIGRGVMTEDDPREPWFLCYSHSAQDVAETLTAFEDAIRTVTGKRPAKTLALAA